MFKLIVGGILIGLMIARVFAILVDEIGKHTDMTLEEQDFNAW